MPYTDQVADEDEVVPDFVNEGTEEDSEEIVGEDISGAHGNRDWIDAARGVQMTIKKAVLKTITPKGEDAWKKKVLVPYLQVGPLGTDGKGKYARKCFFPEFVVAINRAEYDFSKNAQGKPTDFYTPVSGNVWADYNEFLKALGFPNNPAPNNNKAFRDSLAGRSISYDITLRAAQGKDESGNYVDLKDEFKNELKNARAVKAKAAAAEAEEAAE